MAGQAANPAARPYVPLPANLDEREGFFVHINPDNFPIYVQRILPTLRRLEVCSAWARLFVATHLRPPGSVAFIDNPSARHYETCPNEDRIRAEQACIRALTVARERQQASRASIIAARHAGGHRGMISWERALEETRPGSGGIYAGRDPVLRQLDSWIDSMLGPSLANGANSDQHLGEFYPALVFFAAYMFPHHRMLAFLFDHIYRSAEEDMYPGVFGGRFALMFITRRMQRVSAVSCPPDNAHDTWNRLQFADVFKCPLVARQIICNHPGLLRLGAVARLHTLASGNYTLRHLGDIDWRQLVELSDNPSHENRMAGLEIGAKIIRDSFLKRPAAAGGDYKYPERRDRARILYSIHVFLARMKLTKGNFTHCGMHNNATFESAFWALVDEIIAGAQKEEEFRNFAPLLGIISRQIEVQAKVRFDRKDYKGMIAYFEEVHENHDHFFDDNLALLNGLCDNVFHLETKKYAVSDGAVYTAVLDTLKFFSISAVTLCDRAEEIAASLGLVLCKQRRGFEENTEFTALVISNLKGSFQTNAGAFAWDHMLCHDMIFPQFYRVDRVWAKVMNMAPMIDDYNQRMWVLSNILTFFDDYRHETQTLHYDSGLLGVRSPRSAPYDHFIEFGATDTLSPVARALLADLPPLPASKRKSHGLPEGVVIPEALRVHKGDTVSHMDLLALAFRYALFPEGVVEPSFVVEDLADALHLLSRRVLKRVDPPATPTWRWFLNPELPGLPINAVVRVMGDVAEHQRSIVALLSMRMAPADLVLQGFKCPRRADPAADPPADRLVGRGTNMHALSAVLQQLYGHTLYDLFYFKHAVVTGNRGSKTPWLAFWNALLHLLLNDWIEPQDRARSKHLTIHRFVQVDVLDPAQQEGINTCLLLHKYHGPHMYAAEGVADGLYDLDLAALGTTESQVKRRHASSLVCLHDAAHMTQGSSFKLSLSTAFKLREKIDKQMGRELERLYFATYNLFRASLKGREDAFRMSAEFNDVNWDPGHAAFVQHRAGDPADLVVGFLFINDSDDRKYDLDWRGPGWDGDGGDSWGPGKKPSAQTSARRPPTYSGRKPADCVREGAPATLAATLKRVHPTAWALNSLTGEQRAKERERRYEDPDAGVDGDAIMMDEEDLAGCGAPAPGSEASRKTVPYPLGRDLSLQRRLGNLRSRSRIEDTDSDSDSDSDSDEEEPAGASSLSSGKKRRRTAVVPSSVDRCDRGGKKKAAAAGGASKKTNSSREGSVSPPRRHDEPADYGFHQGPRDKTIRSVKELLKRALPDNALSACCEVLEGLFESVVDLGDAGMRFLDDDGGGDNALLRPAALVYRSAIDQTIKADEDAEAEKEHERRVKRDQKKAREAAERATRLEMAAEKKKLAKAAAAARGGGRGGGGGGGKKGGAGAGGGAGGGAGAGGGGGGGGGGPPFPRADGVLLPQAYGGSDDQYMSDPEPRHVYRFEMRSERYWNRTVDKIRCDPTYMPDCYELPVKIEDKVMDALKKMGANAPQALSGLYRRVVAAYVRDFLMAPTMSNLVPAFWFEIPYVRVFFNPSAPHALLTYRPMKHVTNDAGEFLPGPNDLCMEAIRPFLDLYNSTQNPDGVNINKLHLSSWDVDAETVQDTLEKRHYLELCNGFFAFTFEIIPNFEDRNDSNRGLVMSVGPNRNVIALHRVYETDGPSPYPQNDTVRFFPPDHRDAFTSRYSCDAFDFSTEYFEDR